MIKKSLILAFLIILLLVNCGCIENLFDNNNPGSLKYIYVDAANNGPWRGTQQDPFRYIQDAIDKAITGSEIIISPGTYNENLVINTTVHIMATGPEQTIINGNKTSNIVNINADNVTIKNLTIINTHTEFNALVFSIE